MFKFDKKSVQAIIQQDTQAYHKFYEKTVHVFYRYLASHYFLTRPEMDDLLSDFYLKFRQVAHKYDDHFKFESFVWTVFKNLVKDYFKKSKESHYDDEYLEEKLEVDMVAELFELEFKFEQIKQAMSELDQASQEIIFLKFIEEKTYEEISDFLGIHQDAVRQRLSRALKKLKDILT